MAEPIKQDQNQQNPANISVAPRGAESAPVSVPTPEQPGTPSVEIQHGPEFETTPAVPNDLGRAGVTSHIPERHPEIGAAQTPAASTTHPYVINQSQNPTELERTIKSGDVNTSVPWRALEVLIKFLKGDKQPAEG